MISDDEKAVEWALLLVPMAFIDDATAKHGMRTKLHMHRAVEMGDASAAEQAIFYRELLKRDWLPRALRRVILLELGSSLRQYQRDYETGGTIMMLHLIEERKAAMRAQGLRPRGGVHDAAVAEIARRVGVTATALKQRMARYQRRRKN